MLTCQNAVTHRELSTVLYEIFAMLIRITNCPATTPSRTHNERGELDWFSE